MLLNFLRRLFHRAPPVSADADAALETATVLTSARFDALRGSTLPDWLNDATKEETSQLVASCVVLVSCDPDYFRHFALPFARSLAMNGRLHAALHLHVVNPDRWIAGEIAALRREVPAMSVLWSESTVPAETADDSAARTAIACSRFIALPGLLKLHRRPVLVADIDVVIEGALDEALAAHMHDDVVVTRRDPENEKAWLRFVPVPLLVRPTAAGIAFAEVLARYLAYSLERGIAPWGLDRIGLAAACLDAQSNGMATACSGNPAWPISASLDHNPDALRSPSFRSALPRLRRAFDWTLPGSDIFFPTQLAHSRILLDRPTWEGPMLEACVAHFGRRRRALDIGAHVGFWSRWLAHHFTRVEAFEPQALLCECLRANVYRAKLTIHQVALGERSGSIAGAFDSANTGMSHVIDNAQGDIALRRLDEFGFDDVDFIKLDAEGYELFVLRGGVETLRRNKPMVLVEQTEWNARYGVEPEAAVAFLESLGARVVQRMSKYDFLLGWEQEKK